jgi:hypothetical protein
VGLGHLLGSWPQAVAATAILNGGSGELPTEARRSGWQFAEYNLDGPQGCHARALLAVFCYNGIVS